MEFAAGCRFLKRQPDDGRGGIEMPDGGAGDEEGIAVDHMGLAIGVAAIADFALHAKVSPKNRAASPGSL